MTLNRFMNQDRVMFSNERAPGMGFRTHYTRFPYSTQERYYAGLPKVKQTVQNIISNVHNRMKSVPKEQFVVRKPGRKNHATKHVEGYKPTDEELRDIEINAEKLSQIDYRQRKAILESQTRKLREQHAKQMTNPYDINQYLPNISNQAQRSKPTIPQVKASLMTKKHLNRRRHSPIYDWEAENYRSEKQMNKGTSSKNMLEELMREFARLKNNHEGLAKELQMIRSNLQNIDERLDDNLQQTSYFDLDANDASKPQPAVPEGCKSVTVSVVRDSKGRTIRKPRPQPKKESQSNLADSIRKRAAKSELLKTIIKTNKSELSAALNGH